jgi:poly(3-hydroxyalkanoate) synthetase
MKKKSMFLDVARNEDLFNIEYHEDVYGLIKIKSLIKFLVEEACNVFNVRVYSPSKRLGKQI